MAQTHTLVKGSERIPLPGARALGAAHAEQWVEVTVKLKRKTALPELTERPKQILTRDELAAKYGSDPADVEKAAKAFSAMGLEVLHTDPKTRTVELGGTVSAMNAAFGVKLMRFKHDGEEYRGRVGAVQIPSELSNLVEGVFGLDNRRVNKRHPHTAAMHATAVAKAKAKSHPWFFPADLAGIYNFPNGDGTEQCIGLLEFDGGYFESDLQAFCQAANVPMPTLVPISVDGTPTNQMNDAAVEVMLDVEVVAGVCPKATIPVYFSSFTEKGWINALDAVIQDKQNDPSVVSISWGNSEDGAWWTASAIQQVNEAFKEAALLGITICLASGDDGSSDAVMDGHAHVDFPASSPYVLAVGGTTLRKSGAGVSEVAWKDGDGLRQDNGGSTGGGVSVVFTPPPTWQTNTAVASVNPGAQPGRTIPDVAADASANTGYFMVIGGKNIIEGGTSAASPLWAGLIARMNAKLPAGKKRVGYLTPLLYQAVAAVGQTVGGAGCRDITQGENSTAAVGGYSSNRGYDAVTGWGVPNGTALLAAVTPLI
jgi:kumamolisin